MPLNESAKKKKRLRAFLVSTMVFSICMFLVSCAVDKRPEVCNTASLAASSPSTQFTAEPTPEVAAAPLPTEAATPSLSPASTPTPKHSATPSPTPKPTARPAVKATAKPRPAPTVAKRTPSPRPTARPTAKATPAATAAPASGGLKSLESKMISLVNGEREKAGLGALKYDASLRAGALKHSNDMSANDYFSHTSPTYGSFTARLSAAHISYTSAGENIAMYGSVDKAHEALMNSPGHRANILGEKFTRIGIGIVYNKSRGVYYITQWFAK